MKREVVLRELAEKALRKSEEHYGRLLDQSQRMQEQLRLAEDHQIVREGLARAIREVSSGRTFFSRSISKRVQNRLKRAEARGASKKSGNHLSSREVEVLQLISEGKPNYAKIRDMALPMGRIDLDRLVRDIIETYASGQLAQPQIRIKRHAAKSVWE